MKDHEMIRKELWANIARSYVNSSNSTDADGAARWADKILSDFDKRFKPPITSINTNKPE